MSKARQPILNYEGLYEITDTGQVYSMPRKGSKGGLRLPYKDKAGYYRIGLCKDGRQKTCLVHQLVAATFIGENTDSFLVCHKDGNPDNNAVSNLYYGTKSDNSKDAVKHGTHNFLKANYDGDHLAGEDCTWSKLDEGTVRYIKQMKGQKTCRNLAKELNISYANVSAIWCGRSWRHVA